MLLDGVIRSFEVIAVVVKRLDPALTSRYPRATGTSCAHFRGDLIHQYQEVRLDLVWDFAQEDLPALKAAVVALLTNLEDAGTL